MSLFWHCWHFLAGLVSVSARQSTPEELRLQAQVHALEAVILDQQQQLAAGRHHADELESALKLRGMEVEFLNDILEELRLQVRASQAASGAYIAAHTVPRTIPHP